MGHGNYQQVGLRTRRPRESARRCPGARWLLCAAVAACRSTAALPEPPPPPQTLATPHELASAAQLAWPSLDFRRDPAGLGPQVVALTFDDGPDGGGSPEGRGGHDNTQHVLDGLAAANIKATFFVCSRLMTDLRRDALAQATLRRIVAEGHGLGNHTAHHRQYSATSAAQAVVQEMADVQAAVVEVLGPGAPELTVYRMPYGVPFQGSAAGGYVGHAAAVAALAGQAQLPGVHIGWGIDTRDWDCQHADDGIGCVLRNLEPFITAGSSGVILMHSIARVSGDALPHVIARLRRAGYQFTGVEDMIRARYGLSSRQIARAQRTRPAPASARAAAALNALAASEWTRGMNPY